MNSVFKIKKKGVSILYSSLLKGNFLFKFPQYSFLSNHREHSALNRLSSITNPQRFHFCSEPQKEKKEEKVDKPKGIDKFYKKEEKEQKVEEEEEEPENKNEDPKKNEKKDEKKDNEYKEKLNEFLKENKALIASSVALLVYIILYLSRHKKTQIREIAVNEFNTYVENRQIKSIEITKDKISPSFFNVLAYLNDNSIVKLNIISHETFLKALESKQFEMNVQEKEFIPIKLTSVSSAESGDENNLLPVFVSGLLFALIFRLFKNYKTIMKSLKSMDKKTKSNENDFSKGLGGFKGFNLFDYGKTNVKEFGTENKVNVKFKNVAGMKAAKKEVMEFVDFLKHPEKYHKLGAKIPRGALLIGPPGTGKTMLAKAVAGEAAVPFFAISGSDFVEMFVGVGAARVRDLFKKAKEKAPSIVFIDEIDAVGRKRGGKFTGGNDERDNTLNQLLVEMDGFGTENNVIVLAATNRADILDSALLRPGRFDRQVEITMPDRKDREEIFKIYLKKVKTDKSRSIDEYAMRLSTLTPGFSGADISNLVNEAAIISARNDKESVDSQSFEAASDRIIAGLETRRMLSEKERRIVAYHESGHAVVGYFLEHSSPLVKLTIIPRSKGALGFTQFVPDDVYLRSTEHLHDLICGLLGGRLAEEKFFGSITTGASDDLQKITNIANAMVTKYGMSSLGLTAYPSGDEEGFGMGKPYSSHTESVRI